MTFADCEHAAGRMMDDRFCSLVWFTIERIQEAIALCLDDDPGAIDMETEFVGLQQVVVER